MSDHYILDEHRNLVKVDMMVWARWFENMDNRRVAETFTETVRISTVFLGLDHNWSKSGPPIVFESMAFGEHGEELACERYATWQQARLGHLAMVKKFADVAVEATLKIFELNL